MDLTITPEQMPAEIEFITKRGLMPIVTSSPGVGKSSIVGQVADHFRLKLIPVSLAQYLPEDMNGMPEIAEFDDGVRKSQYVPFDTFPTEHDAVPEGYQGWLLFLDELPSAAKAVQPALYKLILDRMVANFKLNKRCIIVGAGNKMTDNAVVNSLSTALQSRMVHLNLEVSLPAFSKYAEAKDLDNRIIGFLNFRPELLMDFRPDHQDKTFACPRTWEFLSKLIKGEKVLDANGNADSWLPRLAGTVGTGAATEFVTFLEQYQKIPRYEEIIADPINTAIPDSIGVMFGTISMLSAKFQIEDIDELEAYTNRFDLEKRIMFARGVHARHPDLAVSDPKFKAYIKSMVKYIR